MHHKIMKYKPSYVDTDSLFINHDVDIYTEINDSLGGFKDLSRFRAA